MMPPQDRQRCPNRERGVALIQVLILSTVLALMTLHFTLTGRSQVQIAQSYQDKALAKLQLKSLESRALFELMTNTLNERMQDNWSDGTFTALWNFHGAPFSPGSGEYISLQAVNGLVSVYDITTYRALRGLFEGQGVPEDLVVSHVGQIYQWQGRALSEFSLAEGSDGRGDFLRHISELRLVPDLSETYIRKLTPYLTNLQVIRFNPYAAPVPILRTMLTEEIVDEIVRLRDASMLDVYRFLELTNFEEGDFVVMVPDGRFVYKLEVQVGQAVARKEGVWYIRPESRYPVTYLR